MARWPKPPEGTWTEHFGLGLWIVRRNVEAMGGVVAAENRALHWHYGARAVEGRTR